jgi:arginase family enzyme
VLDPELALANEFAAPGGLTVEQVQEAIRAVAERFTICASGIASYDPQYDKNDEVLNAGVAIMKVSWRA